MQDITATKIASLTELREPGKVFDFAGDKPVAIMNRNSCMGYLVPIDAINAINPNDTHYVDNAKFEEILKARLSLTSPVLDYLQDK